MLDNLAILVVEDEPVIAMALTFAIWNAGGVVIGPASSVRAALSLLETHCAGAAILDFNLTDGVVTPILERLMHDNVPLIIQTGVGIPAELAARFPDLIVRIKPVIADDLVAELALLIDQRQMAVPAA